MTSYKNKVNAIRFWLDIFIITICFFVCTLYFTAKHNSSLSLLDLGFLCFQLTGWYFTSKSNLLYDEYRSRRGLAFEILKTISNIFFQAALAGLFLFTLNHPFYGRIFVVFYFLLLIILLPLEKVIFKRIILGLRKRGKNLRNVLIIGAGNVGMDFYHIIKSHPNFGYKVIGFLDDNKKPSLNGQYLGTVDQLRQMFQQEEPAIHEVIVALPQSASEKISAVAHIANNEGVRVRVIPDYINLLSAQCGVDIFAGIPMITLRHEPLEEYQWQLLKRAFDIAFSAFVLIFIGSWLFPLIGIIIRINSKGPIFFKQQRLGKDKIPFTCLKFRSMALSHDAHTKQATKGDARITSVGSFLRKTSLDELPQFINVLLGNMSVVGPRPHMMKHNEEYSKIINQYMVRQLVKPGITGWAQVNGYRGETQRPEDMEKRVEYDVWYLENWSLVLDLKIIFLTVWNVIKGEENAY